MGVWMVWIGVDRCGWVQKVNLDAQRLLGVFVETHMSQHGGGSMWSAPCIIRSAVPHSPLQ
eukprot:349694-Chlamydomonas_euryale.AAC.1